MPTYADCTEILRAYCSWLGVSIHEWLRLLQETFLGENLGDKEKAIEHQTHIIIDYRMDFIEAFCIHLII